MKPLGKHDIVRLDGLGVAPPSRPRSALASVTPNFARSTANQRQPPSAPDEALTSVFAAVETGVRTGFQTAQDIFFVA
jgi:hypothetical protein